MAEEVKNQTALGDVAARQLAIATRRLLCEIRDEVVHKVLVPR